MTSFAKGFGQKSDEFLTVSCPVGLENGNGNLKAMIDGHSVLFPAYIAPDFATDSDEFFPGLVTIEGRNYLTGDSAQFAAGMARISDNEQRKAEFALPMLLGALSRLQRRPQWDLKVVVSAQSSEIRAQLPTRLNGRYEVTLNNVDRTVVNIQVLATVPEGATVSAFYPGTVAVIDIGFGDLQALVVQQFKLLRPTVRYRGIDWIVSQIDSLLKSESKGADRAAIRSAIDDGTFRTAGLQPINFREQYEVVLESWFTSQLEPVLREIKSVSGIQKVVAIGGGANNTQIRARLQQYAIVVPEAPEMLGAKALYQIAKAKAN